jgi:transcription-repair coupling factor (mfd)
MKVPAAKEWAGNWHAQKDFWSYGLSFSARSMLVSMLPLDKNRLLICQDQEHLERWREDLLTWLPDNQIWEFPHSDWFRLSTLAKGMEIEMKRLGVLNELSRKERFSIVLTTAEALIEPVIAPVELLKRRKALKIGERLEIPNFLEWLVIAGYERADQVEEKGQFAVRGGIVDLFSPDQELPLRIEWFDDEIDTLRIFSVETQRTVESLQNVEILPIHLESEKKKLDGFLFDYFDESDWLVMDDPLQCREAIQVYRASNEEFSKQMLDWKKVLERTNFLSRLFFSLLLRRVPGVDGVAPLHLECRTLPSYREQRENFLTDLKAWSNQKWRTLIWMSSIEKAENLGIQLKEEGVSVVATPEDWRCGTILIASGWLDESYELPQAGLAILTEKHLFGKGKKPRRRIGTRARKKSGIKHFRDIHAGDYVVHSIHGIGRYCGVETVEVEGIKKDYLLIRYAGEDKLFLPTDQVGVLQKYIGNDGDVPRIHKLGGNEWTKIKAKAKASAQDIAKELIEIYAQRRSAEGFAFDLDTPWQQEFEEAFPYEETEDQLHAIEDVKVDMEKIQPMDRLICGDVGFGKTEIAIRAAFKAVMNGKQVAVLVPTTVLAYQHHQTFGNRFAGFGPTVELISRYRTTAERKQILKRVESGKVDVLIGTHSILQKGISFKDLGLLVIDEEQRFGVAQKEKWKSWRPNVDILALSATPIPRTLHMSLTGIRDMSIIDTAPEERRPVQTYVAERREDLVKEAIERELRRGGQVYVIYNRIQGLEKFAAQIKELLPEVQVAMAHGRLTESQMEDVLQGFYEGEYDVLVSTSIVENGLDIPNANTILVYDADKLGLSQLYQMRGRVGRSRRQAYAYFLYEPDKILTEVAEKRLQTLLDYTELGAGFKIAMRDLEIRGAGNLLGAQQHGQIASVGFEMYCQLIEEAVQELSPEKKQGVKEKAGMPVVIDLPFDAHLPSEYVAEPLHKIEIYQTIIEIQEREELSDFVDELIDRFGEPPAEMLNLIKIAALRVEARKSRATTISFRNGAVEVVFGEKSNVNPEKWIKWHQKYSEKLQLFKRNEETLVRVKTPSISGEVIDFLTKMLRDFQSDSEEVVSLSN